MLIPNSTRKYHSLQQAMRRNTDFGLPDECWEWQGNIDKNGYGRFNMMKHTYFAHQTAYLLHYGERPSGINVCHHCDNPACVNPYHLFIGTQADNVADCIAKGRKTNPPKHIGSKHPHSKLTEDDVKQIRILRADGLTYRAIGNRFRVTYYAIYDVCNRSWKHVT
ncbi:hypothetical protein LCGC14_0387220 [marine sediment metagenome]|uniref:HNH nuclease domain-containing protein n=1 Tax=marine sediment metagenome TaxID=412755 RepID=A0A0F9T6L3_9ZZZZ